MPKPSLPNLRQRLMRVIPNAIAKATTSQQLLTMAATRGWLNVSQGKVKAGLAQLHTTFERAASRTSNTAHYHLPDVMAAGALAWAYYNLGDYIAAQQMGNYVRHAPYQAGYATFAVLGYSALASVALAQGDKTEAWRWLTDGLNYCGPGVEIPMTSKLHAVMAHWHVQHGNPIEARPCAAAAWQVAQHFHINEMIPTSLMLMAWVEARLGYLETAQRRADEARVITQKTECNPWTLALCALYGGEVWLQCGEHQLAGETLAQSASLAHWLGAREIAGRTQFAQARLKWLDGDLETARLMALQSASALRSIGHVAADEIDDWLVQHNENNL